MSRKTLIKMWIVVVITGVMCFSDWSFAVTDETGELWFIAKTLDFIISVLSWIWIVFANLAWKFLTNNWVYGQALKLDALLWQYWNIVKNMANFCLWFYLVYVIFNWLIWQYKWKENIFKNLWGMLKRILVAWIWIQASRFLTSVVVDLSTITLSAAWALPSQIISNSEYTEESIEKSMADFLGGGGDEVVYWKIHNLFPEDAAANSFTETKIVSLNKSMTKENMIDALLPNKDDVSGPLYYMWFAILRTQEINSIKSYGGLMGTKKTILNLIIQWWTTIIYSIEVWVLCIIALMRVLYLWMFIVLSPFAILLACIGKTGDKELLQKWFIADLMKQINLKTFVAKVFQPVIIVLWISLSMIFVTLISRIVNDDPNTRSMEFELQWAEISSLNDKGNTNNDDKTYITSVEGNLVKFSLVGAWKWILDIMMSIITVVLVYLIIDMSIKIWNDLWWWQDFFSNKIEGVRKWVKGIMTSLPVIPVAWYDKNWLPETHYISAGTAFGIGEDKKWKWLIWQKINQYQGKVNEKYNEQTNIIRSWFDKDNAGYLSSDEETDLTNVMRVSGNDWWDGLKRVKDKINEIKNSDSNKNWKWMTLNPQTSSNNGLWISQFTSRLNDRVDRKDYSNAPEDWQRLIEAWGGIDSDKSKRTLKRLFDLPNHANTYANYFGYTSWNYTNFDSIMNLDISKK